MKAGQHVKLGFIHADGNTADVADGIVTSIEEVQGGEPILAVAFFNPKRPGSGALDQIDFRHTVKHRSHEHVQAGKELVTWEYAQYSTELKFGHDSVQQLTREETFAQVLAEIDKGEEIHGILGANLHDFIEALNQAALTYVNKFRAVQSLLPVEAPPAVEEKSTIRQIIEQPENVNLILGKPSDVPVTRTEVFVRVHEAISHGTPITAIDGANLGDLIDALNDVGILYAKAYVESQSPVAVLEMKQHSDGSSATGVAQPSQVASAGTEHASSSGDVVGVSDGEKIVPIAEAKAAEPADAAPGVIDDSPATTSAEEPESGGIPPAGASSDPTGDNRPAQS